MAPQNGTLKISSFNETAATRLTDITNIIIYYNSVSAKEVKGFSFAFLHAVFYQESMTLKSTATAIVTSGIKLV